MFRKSLFLFCVCFLTTTVTQGSHKAAAEKRLKKQKSHTKATQEIDKKKKQEQTKAKQENLNPDASSVSTMSDLQLVGHLVAAGKYFPGGHKKCLNAQCCSPESVTKITKELDRRGSPLKKALLSTVTPHGPSAFSAAINNKNMAFLNHVANPPATQEEISLWVSSEFSKEKNLKPSDYKSDDEE